MVDTPVSKPKENHAVPVPRATVRAIADFAGTTIESVLDRLAGVFTPEMPRSIAEELKEEQAAVANDALQHALGEGVSTADIRRSTGLTPDGGIPIVLPSSSEGAV